MNYIKNMIGLLAAGTMFASMAAIQTFASTATTTTSVSAPTVVTLPTYNDKETITSGIELSVPNVLAFTQPMKDISTPTKNFYLTGSSNPDQPLFINGTEITNRGVLGSFGVYVELVEGGNRFTAQQGSNSVGVTIVRDPKASSPFRDPIVVAPSTNKLTGAFPTFSDYTIMGEAFILSCTAPAGASITATLAGQSIQMQQKKTEGVKTGTATAFTGKLIPNAATANVTNLGQITYTMTHQGNTTTWTSSGSCYLVAPGTPLVAEVVESSANIFPEDNTKNWNLVTVLRKGSRCYIVGQNDNMVKLSTGGWISKNDIVFLEGANTASSKVTGISVVVEGRNEKIILSGTQNPSFTSNLNAEKFEVTFHNTTGINNIPIQSSKVIKAYSIKNNENGSTTLSFDKQYASSLWGWDVSYDGAGNTILTLTAKPSLAPDGSLSGLTIALDAGHGGTDPGAVGIMKGTGPREKDLTLANAVVLQRRLESLGANVVLVRPSDDQGMSLTERTDTAYKSNADMFISLHINSLDDSVNGLRGKGVEVFTHDYNAMPLAANISSYISAYTGRNNRGAKYSNYKVTMYTYAPSMLCELGFICNPQEYDAMCSTDGIYNTANAIANAIIATLSKR